MLYVLLYTIIFFFLNLQSYWPGLGMHSGRHFAQFECVSWVEHGHHRLHWPLHPAASTNAETHQPLHAASAGGLSWGMQQGLPQLRVDSVRTLLWPLCVFQVLCVGTRTVFIDNANEQHNMILLKHFTEKNHAAVVDVKTRKRKTG